MLAYAKELKDTGTAPRRKVYLHFTVYEAVSYTHLDVYKRQLYPILKRLEAGGFVTTYSMEHNSRLRKYYRLTDQGRQRIRDFLVEWQDVMRAYRYIAASHAGGATPLRKDETP